MVGFKIRATGILSTAASQCGGWWVSLSAALKSGECGWTTMRSVDIMQLRHYCAQVTMKKTQCSQRRSWIWIKPQSWCGITSPPTSLQSNRLQDPSKSLHSLMQIVLRSTFSLSLVQTQPHHFLTAVLSSYANVSQSSRHCWQSVPDLWPSHKREFLMDYASAQIKLR